MSVTLEDLQPYIDKEAIFHVIQDDGSLNEITGTIKAASVAGVAYKEKGKSGMELIPSVDKIEEIDYAPIKEKSVTQKKLKPIEYGNARQHLVDRHGVELKWAKENNEKSAFDWHEQLDHTNLGHIHVVPEEKKADERQEAIAEQAPSEPDGPGVQGPDDSVEY